jgi:hypothetical protein
MVAVPQMALIDAMRSVPGPIRICARTVNHGFSAGFLE